MTTLGSLCTGYGGLDLACEAFFGADLVWVSEIDKDAAALLEVRFPGVPNLGDLTIVDWGQVEPVDVLCAGYPCQPYSTAGQRRGDADERAIFDYVRDAISVLRPGVVVLENVAGHLTLGGPGVVGALAGLGYDCRWGVVRASDAGAPHRRARWFCVASRGGQPVMLPTPVVNDMGAGKTVAEWDAWTADMQARHGNGNGHGASLAIEAARLLPSPRAPLGDSRNSQAWIRPLDEPQNLENALGRVVAERERE
tara:strand:+ start:18053 stop:18811 length:759 start_codon:yes stop_codon:yes gene_type:complete